MKNTMRANGLARLTALAMLAMLILLLGGCAADATATPSPSPTVAATEMAPEASPIASAMPSPDASPDMDVLRPVGEEAEIRVGTTRVPGVAYYAGMGDDTILLPLAEVARALGWTVTEPAAASKAEIRLTRAGAEDVAVVYTRPADASQASAIALTATKGGKPVDAGDAKARFIGDTLCVSEAFIDKALQSINVVYDGAATIDIEGK
ncbi:hypothetical protein FACS1894196_0790 [Clostridia bacterium]|nr:hypothetical protein FACS1894196_0790 [Clostridia bacterium]